MTDKERLNLLKNDVLINAVNNGMKRTTIGYEEACWLIEQAERVNELEELICTHAPHGRNYTNEQYVMLREQVQDLESENRALKAVAKSNKFIGEQYLEQNKRYREELEFYAEEQNYDTEVIVSDYGTDVDGIIVSDRGHRARKALEDSE